MSGAREWEGFFSHYAEAFDSFDAEEIAAFYHVPCLLIHAPQVAVLSTRSAVLANMRSLVATYRSLGYKRAHFGDLRAVLLDPRLALVTVPWTLDLIDGSFRRFRNTYEVVEQGGDWQIVVSTTHESGSVDAPRELAHTDNGGKGGE